VADVSRLRRGRLGTPPSTDEASRNLLAPESAPTPTPPPKAGSGSDSGADIAAHMASRPDGRSLRKTNRVVPLALRVTPEFDGRLRAIAARDRLLLAEVLERALAAYERQ
jgi:hypothetical protein